jgi:hypothetical protein
MEAQRCGHAPVGDGMNCKYEVTVRAICPIHKVQDTYDVTVESPHEIIVESILEFVAALATVEETQENLTDTIASKFPGTQITSVGYHSGVKTTVVAP